MKTTPAKRPSTRLQVTRATPEQEPILANLLELYAHDFSEFYNLDLGPEGRFGYPDLSQYWREPDRHPFLVMIDGKLTGFALIKKGTSIPGGKSVWDMAEFFVIRSHRRRGMGTKIAQAVWRQFPGQWQVRVMRANRAGCLFWERTIAKFACGQVEAVTVEGSDATWHVFTFDSPGDAAAQR